MSSSSTNSNPPNKPTPTTAKMPYSVRTFSNNHLPAGINPPSFQTSFASSRLHTIISSRLTSQLILPEEAKALTPERA
ncbi:hypothetical protein HO173_011246 [Letharia columbiana]|uniref:Uncharacterized protein n=1 Tax=Letharia columbiana TaxID=112416 RepID=A0A8H6KZE4_9LECA|nr:uncharacterized protein HO173_011246 [Letharia columbiana]KAF6229816.1 hypothetical protein HO173_011246 [Letharia columbiana]